MSHAARQFAPAGNAGFAHTARLLMIVAALIATLVAGAAMFGHSSSAAASHAAAPMADAALQGAAFAGTDPSVPQASAVFSARRPTSEEDCPTF